MAGPRPKSDRRQRSRPTRKAKPTRAAARRSRARRATAAGGATAKRTGAKRKDSSRLAATAEAAGRLVGRTVRAVADRMPWGHDGADALALLERDHRRLEELLEAGEDASPRARKQRTALLATLTVELNAHELIEEKILYPALKPHAEAKQIVLEGYQEHHVADLLLEELHDLAKSDERWGAKFKVLKENIEHHIEEEEGEMFRTARSVLSRSELEAMGARMAALKAEALRG